MSTANAHASTGKSNKRKRSAADARSHDEKLPDGYDAQAQLLPFRSSETPPADIRTWPREPGNWLEPVFCLVPPHTAGVRIERRYMPLLPTFQPVDAQPNCGRRKLGTLCELRQITSGIAIPAGDITLLGWDARAALKYRESQ